VATPPTADVALLTESRYTAATAAPGDWYLGNILADDRLLIAALATHGLSAVRVDWASPLIAWDRFRTAVFRTTWDYFDRAAAFARWLDDAAGRTRLCNPPATVRWNMDKHYLADLERRGIPVVPTRFIPRGSVDLADLIGATGWHDAVIKPCISGGARHTHRVSPATAAAVGALVADMAATEDFMLQPFEPGILTAGEDSLIVIGGRFTHAVRKRARPGDYRVQDDHGGTVHPRDPTAAQIALAEGALAACPPIPTYGRVDMVEAADGTWRVMELELIEPELWLRLHPPAAVALAAAIAAGPPAREPAGPPAREPAGPPAR
jgi:glutathione synthase/RimK-type ligase-like ATP-grasp enzyme